jgi:hypothetical protein
MSNASWQDQFSQLFHPAVEKYRAGHTKASGLLDAAGVEFLGTIGYTEQEFFDFVEDFARGGDPTLETALQIAAVRRDYFLNEQGGKATSARISMADLPSKDAKLEDIGWLPRIIVKAEAKLHGEMPPDLMYGCGGDRKFFRTNNVDPAAFLTTVWKAKGDQSQIIRWVKEQAASAPAVASPS